MDDMTAFERLIANAATQAVGPTRPVDAMAVVRSAKPAPAGRWSLLDRRFPHRTTSRPGGGFSMFSALKFIAAGIIVALFGGFLLAGVLTTPQGDEVVPAAVSASPEPEATNEPTEAPTTPVRSDILPGVALTVEEVEPGVYRVVSDGVRDVASMDVRVGADGSVWGLIVQPPVDGFFRLGDEQMHAWPVDVPWWQAEVAPDGTVWTIGGRDGHPRRLAIRSFDGAAWTVHREDWAAHWPDPYPQVPLAVAPDGTVWAAWWDGDEKQSLVVARLGSEGWQPLGPPLERKGDHVALFPTDDGLRVVHTDQEARRARTYRYDDGAWQRIGPAARRATVGRDGTIWQYRLARDEAGRRLYKSGGSLARFDGIEWEEFDWEGSDRGPGELTVAADGSLWIERAFDTQAGGGVARFDGARWDHFLPGLEAWVMQPDAAGAVWVVAGTPTWSTSDFDLYVITPEAVAASE